jgi:RNA polymerase sigma-70 factor (ECF subfamily)
MFRAREDFKSLMRAAHAGSKEALGELLQWYWPLLRNLARKLLDRYLRSKMEEAELVQETYLEALGRFPEFRGDSEAEWVVWLERILVHQAYDINKQFRRTHKRDVGRELPLSEDMAMQLQSHEFEEESGARDVLRELLWRSRALLTPHDQLVLRLHYMEGMPFREIAAQFRRKRQSFVRVHLLT